MNLQGWQTSPRGRRARLDIVVGERKDVLCSMDLNVRCNVELKLELEVSRPRSLKVWLVAVH